MAPALEYLSDAIPPVGTRAGTGTCRCTAMALLKFVLKGICLAGMVTSIGYYLACLAATGRFFRRPRPTSSEAFPGITVLKPVKGLDEEALENFTSFCRQDYPTVSYQLIFGVQAADDPAVPLIHRLQEEFPDRDIELVVASRELGHNRKVSSLAQMVEYARYDLLAVSDADIRVGPGYLKCLAEAFADSQVGLVTCPYRGADPRNLPAALLTWGINAEFTPSVFLVERLEGISFALGATMAVRRPALQAIGGFAALANHLADDYQLGNRVFRAGYKLLLAPCLVDHVIHRETFANSLALQLRWARTIRTNRPGGYFWSVITHGTLFSLGYLGLCTFAPVAWALLGVTLGTRMLTAGAISTRYLKLPRPLHYLWLLPLRDLLGSLLWLFAFLGNRVSWRGESYQLGPEGTLFPVSRKGIVDSRQ